MYYMSYIKTTTDTIIIFALNSYKYFKELAWKTLSYLHRYLHFCCCSFIPDIPSFPLDIVSFQPEELPLSFKACLLVMNSLSFLFFENIFILPPYQKDIFCWICNSRLEDLCTLKILFHCFLASVFVHIIVLL